jgi:formylglycine-generating enzyme required for sulfatase activity
VMDLAGNVWQWTDKFLDKHTRESSRRKLLPAAGIDLVLPQAYN